MFHIHGVQGHVFSGTLEQLRHQYLVTGVVRVPRVMALSARTEPPLAVAAGSAGSGHGLAGEAVQAYGQGPAAHVRQPLTRAGDVMSRPALTLPATASLREAWQMLARHGIGQAPVLDGGGVLVGLVGRAELMPALSVPPLSAVAEQARLAQLVTAVMWSPVPCAATDTDLRRVASLLLDTGLPGVPVADAAGGVLGFVSRTDLLRALAHDPPLDLWA